VNSPFSFQNKGIFWGWEWVRIPKANSLIGSRRTSKNAVPFDPRILSNTLCHHPTACLNSRSKSTYRIPLEGGCDGGWVLIFLSRLIIYYTSKMNYSVYSKNRVQECCPLATSDRKGTKNWGKWIIFPRWKSHNLLLALVQIINQEHIFFICPSLTALMWDIFP
jgi:hypothetical protein